jgi:lipoprotein-anchoring transpeptidase ErfK/SrfK
MKNHTTVALFSRRKFLEQTALGFGALALLPFERWMMPSVQFPTADKLGRVNVGMAEIRIKPDADSNVVAKVYKDAVLPWVREVVGRRPYRRNQRWVETPQGYVWAPYLQPVKNLVNPPVNQLPDSSLGTGLWAEVTVPYVDLTLANPPARSPWLKDNLTPRLYYSQVFWIDQTKQDAGGQTWYRVNERYGYDDIFWARAEAFRPLSKDEVDPIHPDAPDIRIVVNIAQQTLACFEGKNEVYYALVSTGIQEDMNGKRTDWGTTPGVRPIWRKLVSVHMSGGTIGGGYDLPGVSWTSLFEGQGVAIHSTYWHNNFGEQMSHGCVNAAPEDAKWVFRWTAPSVAYDPGDLTIGMPGGTTVNVVES